MNTMRQSWNPLQVDTANSTTPGEAQAQGKLLAHTVCTYFRHQVLLKDTVVLSAPPPPPPPPLTQLIDELIDAFLWLHCYWCGGGGGCDQLGGGGVFAPEEAPKLLEELSMLPAKGVGGGEGREKEEDLCD